MLDIKSIGSGGGSISWIDQGDSLRVGPQSAGAYPGPACYGLGGKQATITDAHLVLGDINPDKFLGGTIQLKPLLAEEVLRRLGSRLEKDLIETAHSVHQVAMNEMALLIREMTVNRGYDPVDFKLVSFGGAGALYAADLAEELGIPEIYVPANAGVFSAFGSLCADVVLDYLQTYYISVDKLDFSKVSRIYQETTRQALKEISGFGKEQSCRKEYFFDLRYVGETFEITVPVDYQHWLTFRDLNKAINRFHQEHKRLYGFNRPDEPVELVNLRLRLTIPQPKPDFSNIGKGGSLKDALKGHRQVYFRSAFDYVSTPVYQRDMLSEGMEIEGPAIIEENDSTIVIQPHHRCKIDLWGNIVIYVRSPNCQAAVETATAQEDLTAKLLQMQETAYIRPVAREILGNEFQSICREMGNTMIRTAYSPIFVDGMDFACGILDSQGELVSSVIYCPVHIASMSLVPASVLLEVGLNNLQPGDVLLTNDPFRGGTHITDFTLIKPIFYEGKLVAFATNRAHHLDVGGKAAGGFPGDATEIFQEGIRIPPVKWFRGGVENTDIFNTLLANVRLPWVQIGDFRAQLASVLTAEKRIIRLCEKYGVATLQGNMRTLTEYSEAWLRKEIAAIPDGTYSYEDFIDDDGISDEPRKIKAKINISGSEMVVDFSGTSPQIHGPLNSNYGVTVASVFNALLQVTNPDIPINNGIFRAVKINAPRGSLVNPNYPAATFGANTDTNIRIIDVVMGALAPVLPHRVIAATYGTCNNFTGGGYDPIRKQTFAFYFFNEGGWGASHDRDGRNSTFSQIGNCKDLPVEVVESNYPLLYEKVELRRDSAGAGEYRGGFGTVRKLKVLADYLEVNAIGDRHELKPYGLYDGNVGCSNDFLIIKDGSGTPMKFNQAFGVRSPSKFANVQLKKGESFLIMGSGGGGYGDPLKRDPQKVLQDVEDELVSIEKAKSDYGVVIKKVNGMKLVDYEASAELRGRLQLKAGKNTVNKVIVLDEKSLEWRRKSSNEEEALQDPVSERIKWLRKKIAYDFCAKHCIYKGSSRHCPLHNEEALKYWSLDTLQMWLFKKCRLPFKI